MSTGGATPLPDAFVAGCSESYQEWIKSFTATGGGRGRAFSHLQEYDLEEAFKDGYSAGHAKALVAAPALDEAIRDAQGQGARNERERILNRELVANALTRIEVRPVNGKIVAEHMADALVRVISDELAGDQDDMP